MIKCLLSWQVHKLEVKEIEFIKKKKRNLQAGRKIYLFAMKCLFSGSFYEISSLADNNNELNFSLQYLPILFRYSIKYYSPTFTHCKTFVYNFCVL